DRELHAARPDVELEDLVAVEPAQSAVDVAAGRAEEAAADQREHRVAEVPVQPRHRAALDAAAEAVADDEVVAAAKLGDERLEMPEVVGAVGVSHDPEAPARGRDAPGERASVSALGDADDARALLLGERLRAVARPVVGDDDLAGDPESLDRFAGRPD